MESIFTVPQKYMLRAFLIMTLYVVVSVSMSAEAKIEEDKMIEQVYREALNQYLISELHLEDYDNQLAESEEHFIPNDEESMTSAQKEGNMGLSYIYLRNPLHLERLSEEQKDVLVGEVASAEPGSELSEELLQLIKTTFPNIISEKEILTEQDRKVLTYYDSTLKQDFVTVDTLVLKIGTMPEYDSDGNYVNQDHEFEKEDYLVLFAGQMEDDLNGLLGETPIRVLLD